MDEVLLISMLLVILRATNGIENSMYLDPYNDEILYKIDWLGEFSSDSTMVLSKEADEDITIHTNNDEKYRCKLPYYETRHSAEEDENMNADLSPGSLLRTVLLSNDCVYLVEGYWTYELCHGLHLRQYHEDRNQEGKVINVLEFMLGKQVEEVFPPKGVSPPPIWQYNGEDHPYYEVQFADGSPCDIRDNIGRSVKLAYICDEDHSAIPSLVSVKESRTCEYEAVILTNQLCQNEGYRVKEKPVHGIKCYSMDHSPRKPKAAEEIDLAVSSHKSKSAPPPPDPNKIIRPESPPPSTTLDERFVESFLLAEFCLQGRSTGWWQHELCFGEHVKQVHLENGVVKQKVFLGVWNEAEHKKWFAKAGKSKQSKNHVMHLYADGDICDLTSSPRRVRVKFKCIPNLKASQISIFLEEPTPCNYILTVEAGFICQLLETQDEHGLFRFETAH